MLAPTRGDGEPVQLVVAEDVDDEARQIVDRIKAWTGWDPAHGRRAPAWSEFAVLYRKHRHREAIIARLREEAIPYTVVGGLSLFETPEIRDLEQSLRAIADPLQDVAVIRMMSAAPWRLDALEILQIARMAKYDRRHLIEVVREVVDSGEVEVDRARPTDEEVRPIRPQPVIERERRGGRAVGSRSSHRRRTFRAWTAPEPAAAAATRHEAGPSPADTRAKLRRFLRTIDELTPRTWRDGPFTVLEEFVVKTGIVFDLIALDSLERSGRSPTSAASCASPTTGRPSIRTAAWRALSTTSTPTRPPAASSRQASRQPTTALASSS